MNHESGIKNKSRGFTLIELLVVVSVIAILSALGIAGFKEYNEIQILQGATKDVATMLNQAKSRALSQVKPVNKCTGTIEGYLVRLDDDGGVSNRYRLKILCSGVLDVAETKLLPTNITFDGVPPDQDFFFPVLKGGVETGGTIVLSGYGRTKTITIDSVGGVKIL